MLLQELNKPIDLKAFIQSECSDYLSIPGATSAFLFRGIRQVGDPVVEYYKDPESGVTLTYRIIHRRTDRQPMSMPAAASQVADDYFQRTFGWRARSAGIFAVGSRTIAGTYGPSHIIVPIGNTSFVWSPKVNDLFEVYDNLADQCAEDGLSTSSTLRAFEDFLDFEADYMSGSLERAIKSSHEIMLNCDSYVAIEAKYIIDSTVKAAIKRLLGF